MRRWMVFASLLFSAASATAQDIAIPGRVDFAQFSKDYWQPKEEWTRVWGWSRDGKIAYSKETPLENGKGLDIIFVVKNLVTDTVDGSFTVSSSGWSNAELQRPQDEWAGMLYNAIKPAADDLFAANKIVVGSPTVLQGFPLQFKGFSYTCETNILSTTTYDDGQTMIGSYDVAMKRSDGRRKVVFKGGTMSTGALSVYGYFKSPYENRIAIAFGETSFGEAARFTVVILIGSSLVVGF